MGNIDPAIPGKMGGNAMKFGHLALIVLSATMLGACASNKAKTGDASSGAKPAAAVEGEIIGKPAPGSKFARLKIGMTLPQVVSLIGRPSDQSTHPTGKSAIPFYFGPDRWVIEYFYKGEGRLTLNSGEEQLLTRIEVNKAQ